MRDRGAQDGGYQRELLQVLHCYALQITLHVVKYDLMQMMGKAGKAEGGVGGMADRPCVLQNTASHLQVIRAQITSTSCYTISNTF